MYNHNIYKLLEKSEMKISYIVIILYMVTHAQLLVKTMWKI